MKLLAGETTLSEGSVAGLTLTTHRVRYDRTTSGESELIGITLDAVSSCAVVSKSYPILLLLAALAALGGFLFRNTEDGAEQSKLVWALFLGAAALVVAYFLTRAVVLAIRSPGHSIAVAAKGVKPDALRALVDDVEQAKLRFLGKIPV